MTTNRTARALAIVGTAGPVAYIVLTIVLGLLWDGYNPLRDTQSELGAVDSPYQHVMNIGGLMGLGVWILAFAGAYAMVLRWIWVKTLVVLLLVVAGVGMIVVGFFPCDAGCVDVTRTGRLHGLWSAPGAFSLSAAAMASSQVFRLDGRFSMPWQFASFWGGVLSLAIGPVVGADLVPEWNGLLQRTGMWLAILWMAAVSARLAYLTKHIGTEAQDRPEHQAIQPI